MTETDLRDRQPLDPAQAQLFARVRTLMAVSLIATALGIGAVLAVIGYRVFRTEGSLEATAQLPKGARVIQTAVAGDRIVVTIEIGGAIEIRTFDARTLRPEGRLQFTVEP
jgi:hypothetical protein